MIKIVYWNLLCYEISQTFAAKFFLKQHFFLLKSIFCNLFISYFIITAFVVRQLIQSKQSLMTIFHRFLLVFLPVVCFSLSVRSQTTGTVFRDFNGNGTRQNTAGTFVEPVVQGVIVNAYNSNDVRIASYTTNASGTYSIPLTGSVFNGVSGSNTGSIPNGTPVRLEFIIPASCGLNPAIDKSSAGGNVYGTSVRFVNGGSTANNYAINDPSQYVRTANPYFYAIRHVYGNPLAASGLATTRPALEGMPYTSNLQTVGATTPAQRTLAASFIGSCYGLGYSKPAGKLFTAAYIKRHAGLGTLGSGGIYMIDTSLSTGSVVNFYNLDANGFPTRSNSATGAPAYGSGTSFTVPATTPSGIQVNYLGTNDPVSGLPLGMGVIGTNTQRNLTGDPAAASADAAAYGQVGIFGLGDLEVLDDGSSMFVVNLYDRKIYRLNLNNPLNPTAVSSVSSFSLPNPPLRNSLGGGFAVTYAGDNSQFYDGTKGFLRPFALKQHRGKLYVGAVTTGEGTGAASTTDNNSGNPEYTDLWAYVFEFDLATNTWTPTPVLQFPLNFNRGTNTDSYNETFRLWKNTSMTTGLTWNGAANIRMFYAQAMLTDIEFDPADGSMILGFRDRIGDQVGHFQAKLNGALGTVATALGEVLRAYRTSSCSFELESAGKEGPTSPKAATAGATNGQGPGGGEFYYQDNVYNAPSGSPNATFHLNVTTGSLLTLPGTEELTVTTMDPNTTWAQGIDWFSNNNGTNIRNHIMEQANANDNATGYSAKGSGLGDIELITYGIHEVGNRVWNDANGNGIQDAGEAGIGGVALQLFLDANNDGIPDGAAIGSVTTTAAGEFFFTSASGTDVAGIDYGVNLLPNQNYIIRIAAAEWNSTTGLGTGDLSNYRLTANDVTGNGAVDLSDNDATLTTGATIVPQVRFTTGNYGEHNHNLDFGFKQLASIGDRVWLDQNGNGTQDGTPGTAGYEPGVAGVTVELFRNGTDGLPGTADDVRVGTTVTDAFGNYLFDNLTPTNQTNATTIGQTSYNVKFTPPAKYTFTVSNTPGDNGNNTNSDANPNQASAQYGRTGGYNLTAGEIERSADAGLIFPQPQVASIGDRVWLDANTNGIQDAGEVGVSGVTVTLFRDPDGAGPLPAVPFATTITDANGNYLFNNITPDATATYEVGFTLPIGFEFTTKSGVLTDAANSDVNVSTGRSDAFTVPAATAITTVDAGIRTSALASIGNFVWNDLNQDGVQNAGEPGIAGVTVNLYNSAGTIIATTVTDAFGHYQFTGLAAGTYEIGFVAPAGYTISTAGVGAEWTDSDANTGTGRTGTFTLVAGQNKDDVDAGLFNNNTATLNRLGDRVWFDNNNNGIQDAGEFGAPGVSVALLDANGQPVDDPRQPGFQPYITSTDLNGNYLFTDLPNGSYQVQFYNVPAGYSFITSANAGGATTNNSDASASGYTPVYSLTGSQTNLTVDAGLIRRTETGTASLGNKVFYDVNSNGVQDAGETGVAGVTVTLRTPGADGIAGNGDDVTVATLVTNSLGEYLFTNLSAGVYYVQFSNGPAGYNTSAANAGSDDALDSDGAAGVTISAATSATGLYTLGTGEQNLTVDLGLVKTTAGRGSISNQVWFDTNGNGTFDSGTDAVVPGVQVELLDGNGNAIDPDGAGPLTRTITTTDVNGNYLFDNLAAGNYIVNFSNYPAGLTPIAQDATLTNNRSAGNGAGSTPVITLAASQNLVNIDFGLATTRAALGDRVWNDLNGNGQQDAGEPGLAGVTVILRDAATGNPVASTITDANGNYLFTNLDAGTYVVEFTNIPGNMTFTTKDNGSDASDSDVNPGTGRTDAIVLAAGQVNRTVDAGILNQPTATVGTYVWYDNGFGGGTSGDGIAQAGEPPVAGVLVTLFDAGTNQPLRSAVTNSNGEYRFTNVAPGTYYVVFSELPGPALNFTTQLPGTTDNQSKANALGQTPNFTVAAGDNLVFVDGGLIGAPLPATGLQLTTELSNTTVTLNWKTLSEISTDYFEVEMSTDGRSYTSRSKVTAAGFSASERNYTGYDDVSALSHHGTLYYRVKLYDINGTYRYSNVSVVRINAAGVKAWPNPFTDVIQVTINSTTRQGATLQLTDVSGKRILLQQVVLQKGVNQVALTDLSRLPAGSYYLLITTETNVERKLIQLSRQ
jgi:hypothetical protein